VNDEEFSADIIERALPVFEALNTVDDQMHVVLRGHLLIEERLTRITERFVFHAEHMEAARLSFAQRVSVARSMSLSEHESETWDLILAINALRNDFAHGLTSSKRAGRTDRVLALLTQNLGKGEPSGMSQDPLMRLTFAAALCIGFLESYEAEVKRFREWVDAMDRVANPHRYR
jgi:hypothetical protein